MSPLDAKLILDEIAKLNRRFDESYARMEHCFSRALASLEPRGDAVELCIGSTEQIGEMQPIVADNWGDLFDEIPASEATFTTVLKDIKPDESLLVEYPHHIEKGEEKLQVAPLEEVLSKREVRKRALARPPRLLASLFAPATDAALDSELSGTTGKGASIDALDHDSLAQPAREFVVGDVSAPRPPRLRLPWRAPPRRHWRSPRPTRLRRPRRAPPRPPWRARRRRRAAGMEARHPFRPGLRLRRPQGPPRRPHYRGVPAPTLLPPPPRDAATASPIPTPREASSQVLAAAWRKLGAHSVHAARVFDEMLLCHQPLSASVPTVFTFQCAALPSAAVFHARTAVRGAALSSVGRQGLAIIHDTSALQAEELLSCGGDFTNSCDFNLIGAPVVFVRSCDENMVNLRLLSSSDWVEQQPWPPPPMQVASVCSSAAIRPTPWPPPECIEAMNQDIFATSQESVHCSAYVQNFCQELIYLGIYTRGQVTVIPVLSRGQGFQFRMLNENEFRDTVLLVFANKQDLPIAMNATEIPRKLGLHSIRQRHWYIQNTCATAVNFYSLAVEDDPPATTLCANRSLCWLQQRKGNRVLSNAPLCIVMCPHWSKACHRQGAALNFLKDCKEVVHAFEQALKHARAKSQRTLHMHAPKCLTTDLIALVPWKFWPWLGSYTSDMFRKLRVLWSPRVWGCSSALMLTSSVLLGALLVAQLVSLVFCWELMLQYNADCFSSTYSEPEFLQFPWDPGGSMLLHRLGGRPSLITATRDVMLIVNWQLLALVLPACFVQLQRGGLTEFDSNSYSYEFSISLWELLAVMKSISYMEILLSIFRCLIDMLVWDGPVLLGGNLDWCRFPGCFLLLSSIWPVTKKHQLIGSSDGDCTYDLLLKQPWPPPVLLRLSHAGVVLLLLQWPSFCRYRTDKKSKLLLFRGSTHAAWGQAAFKGEGNVSNMGQYYTMGRTRTSLEAHDANTNKEYKGRKARGVEASDNYQNHQPIPAIRAFLDATACDLVPYALLSQ